MKNLATLLALLFLLTGCHESHKRAHRIENHQIDHVPGSALDLGSRNGRISVHAVAGSAAVELEAKITCAGQTQAEADERLAATTLDIHRDADDTLVIRPAFSGGARGGDGVTLTLDVPDAHGARLKTSNGRVTVENLSGELVVDTSNGTIEVTRHMGPARLDTSNGRVSVTGQVGRLDVDTSNGAIVANEVGGPVDVSTSNGSIMVRLAGIGSINARTSNGSITTHLGEAFEGSMSLSTSNGRVSVDDTGGRVVSQSLHRTGGRLTIGEADLRSNLRTSNGSIRVIVE